MPRRPRVNLVGHPQHVVQRGHNREACFFAEEDYRFYLHWLRESARKYGCAVHAYILMTNHVHLLLTPATPLGLPRLMQSLNRRYAQHINRGYRRSGSVWEGRYKASLINAEEYLLACQRYIELNPVRADMVADPGQYRWTTSARPCSGACRWATIASANRWELPGQEGGAATKRQTRRRAC